MVNLADFSDTSSFVPCKRCAELLQEGDRFCRVCGQDQSDTDGAGDAGSVAEPERGTSTRGGAPLPMEADFADTLQPEAQRTIDRHVPTSAANEDVNIELGLVRPNAFGQMEVPGGGGPRYWAGSSVTTYRLAIGILAALVVLLAFALGRGLYPEKPSGAGRPPGEPASPLAQAPLPPKAPVVATPAPGIGAAEPKGEECSDALTALAMCPKR
jgi:RNA polymerase subunit RPABC4/transcription elongation factor Spt4